MKVKKLEAVNSKIETPPVPAKTAVPPAVNVVAGSKIITNNPDITDEPKSEEHLHMALLGNSLSLRDVYLKVSDDGGEFFGNVELEEAMKSLLDESREMVRNGSIEEVKEFMNKLVNLSSRYHRQINFATNMTSGILVKHQIRLGLIYLQQKRLLKKIDADVNWLDWFGETHGAGALRSGQDFMRLASTPNIIRYAVFGRDRLIEILRGISPYGSSDDPIGDFLMKYGFTFDPEADEFMEDWRSSIDAAVAMEKIKKIERKDDFSLGVGFEQIKTVIDNNIAVDTGIINNMVIVKEAGGNVADYLETLVLGKGSKPVPIERAEKRETVQVLSKKLQEIVAYYSKDTEAISQISRDHVNSLRESVEALTVLLDT
jgi:hypothetical protein